MEGNLQIFAACVAALAFAAPARAADYWLVKTETASGSYSSLSGYGSDVGDFSGWTTTRGGTEKEPFGDGDFRFGAVDPDGVYHVDGTGLANGMCVRLMGETGQVSYAFRGGSLVFEGGKAYVNNKTKGTFAATNLTIVSGTTAELRTGDAGTVYYEGANWVVEPGAALFFGSGQDSTRKAVVRVPITGSGTIGQGFGEDSQYANSTGNLRLECDLGGFSGTIVACEKGINTTANASSVAAAYKKQTLVFADERAVPQSTPDGALLPGAVVVTNGARISFECSATSPALRGWDFGSGQTPTVEVTDGRTATIFGPVAGAAGLNKAGKGTLVLDVGGTGLYGTITLTGSTTLSAADLAAYAETCEAWAAGVPFLGAASAALRADTYAMFDVPVGSIGRGAASATLSALMLEAAAGDPWDDARAVAAPGTVAVSSAGMASFTATGLDPATAYQIRFVLASSHDGEPRTVTNAPVAFATRGALHVDAASAAADPDGSAAAPFPTIKAAVDAANAIAGVDTVIYVAPGTYPISSAGDFAVVTVSNLLVCAEDPARKPVVALAADLCLAQNNPVVFAAPAGADAFTVRDLRFTFSYAADKNAAGNSLGQSGKLFSFAANDCVFDGCEFVQTGTTGRNWADGGLLYSDSSESDRERKGAGLVVRNCLFDHVGSSKFRPIKIAGRSQIVGNVFDACSGFFAIHKQSSGGYFVSNRIVNCTQPILSTGDNWGELPNGEIAYNVFVGGDVAFFEKTSARGYAGQPRFHHNTVVGCSGFVQVDEVNGIDWTPWIFDNLVIASETGCIVRENATSLANRKSSFKEGSFFTGNAWRAPDFVSGTAPTRFADYELSLPVADSKRLVDVPEFLETSDPRSPDYYRLNAARYPWVRSVARGAKGYPATYVGAVEPADIPPDEPGEFFRLDAFDAFLQSDVPPASARFTVGWTGNAGIVTVYWDFDGDGVWDRYGGSTTGTATESYVFREGGVFRPRVRLVDNATSKVVDGTFVSVLRIIATDVYVDANAAPGGNGTSRAPFRTIVEGVQICSAEGTVHVRGGPDRVYTVATADDLVTIPLRSMTVESWGGAGRARIVVEPTLHAATNNASVFTIPVDAVDATLRGLDFTYYGAPVASEASLGTRGRCVDVYGDRATVEDCVFRQSGNYLKSNGSPAYENPDESDTGYGHAAVASRSRQNDQTKGRYLTVRGCRFLGESEDRSMSAVRHGPHAVLAENVFSNCYSVLLPVKADSTPFLLESNVLYRCRTIRATYNNWGEWPNPEFRFNIFWCDPGSAVPFLSKAGSWGLHGENVRIHHNTFVNVSHLAFVNNNITNIVWQPKFFDNLIVLDPADGDGRTIFKNNQTAFDPENHSSFKTGGVGCLRNNVWFAPGGISGGPATEVEGYDISAGCLVTNNIALDRPPFFVSTELESPHFCRPALRNGDWVGAGYAWTDDGAYPDWIGAKPGRVPELYRTIMILR